MEPEAGMQQKKGNRRDTKDPQQLPKNNTMPTARNPGTNTTGWIRIPPNTTLHLQEENYAMAQNPEKKPNSTNQENNQGNSSTWKEKTINIMNELKIP